MGMRENWTQFIEVCNAKRKSHLKAARHWNTVNTYLSLSLIFLAAVTTYLSLLHDTPKYVVSAIAAMSTLLSAVLAFLKATDRRESQLKSSQTFAELMMRMVRVETDPDYEQIWVDYNKALNNEPFLPTRFHVKDDFNWTMTPELEEVIKKKEGEPKEEAKRLSIASVSPINLSIDQHSQQDKNEDRSELLYGRYGSSNIKYQSIS